MAKACLCVLLRLDYLIDEESIKNIPLAEYSGFHFAKHVDFEDVISQIQDGIEDLLDTEKPHFGAWVWIAGFWEGSPKQPEGNPLHYIAKLGSSSLARHLISKHPEYLHTTVDDIGTPLHEAADSDHVEVFEILVEQYVDVDVRDFEDRTPLHRAAFHGRFDISRILIERGADINARNGLGQTPLHRIIDKLYDGFGDIYFDMISFLLGHGADVNAQDKYDRTPLDIASRFGCTKAVQILLEHGADAHIENNQGRTPFQVASERNKHGVMQLLSGHAQSESKT
jgi:cytohesin